MSREYLALTHDVEREAFIECALACAEDFPDGAFCAYMQEALGDDWAEELERLGFSKPVAQSGEKP